MGPFDFVFALFSLLLGLGTAELLGGFARVMKLHARARATKRKTVRVGWLTPLLATLVVIDQISLWMQAYTVRNTLPLTFITMLVVTIIVGGYYLFCTLVFPDDPEEWPDFDLYYDQHNRFILSGLLVLNITSIYISHQFKPPMSEAMQRIATGPANTLAALGMVGSIVLTCVLIFVRRRRLNVLLLLVLIGLILGAAVTVAAIGFHAD